MLTNENIHAMNPGETLKDKGAKGAVPGLEVRRLKTGEWSFMLYYRTKSGQQRRPKIGEFPSDTIGEIRKRAKQLLNRVATGEDPKGDWDNKRAEMTVGEGYAITLTEHWSKARFIRSKRQYEVMNLWENHLKRTFENMKFSDTDHMVIKAWHKSLEDKKYAANRSLEVLSMIFTYCISEGRIDTVINPCRFVKPHKEEKRKRFATAEEAQKINDILERDFATRPKPVTFLFALLFSGSRPKFLEDAEVSDLVIETVKGKKFGVLTIKGKSSEETGVLETVIIPPKVLNLLGKIPRRPRGTLFDCKMPKRYWAEVVEEAGCEGLWARDFRRFFASAAMSSGVDLSMVGTLLNHHTTQTTKGYAFLNQRERIETVASISNTIEEMLSPKLN